MSYQRKSAPGRTTANVLFGERDGGSEANTLWAASAHSFTPTAMSSACTPVRSPPLHGVTAHSHYCCFSGA